MEIKVLGTGCARCKSLEKLTINAVAELNITANIEKVEDIQEIMKYGIIRTPGLIINNKIVLSAQIPSLQELKEIITKNQ